MLGTIINAAAIVAGGALGLILKKGIRESMMSTIMKGEGIAVFVIGMVGVLKNMLSVDTNGTITDGGTMLLLLSLIIGAIIGEALRIDDRINEFGLNIEKRIKSDGFAKGFVNASLIYCIGSMGILGSINDGLTGDYSLLLIKSVLDGVTSVVLASTMGFGVIFSAVPVFIYQGLISLFASSVSSVLNSSATMMSQFTMVGNTLIMCIGLNFIVDAKIKTANLLPAIFVPIIYNVIMMFTNM